EFIAGGAFARHLRALRRQMAPRRAALISALAEWLGDRITILPQEVGLHLTITLNGDAPPGADMLIAGRAAERGLDLAALSPHSDAAGHQGFLLGYAAWDDAKLAAAVETLAQAL
ncbi:MAG TPA: hypothetical protein VF459_19545, partial [Caulobacteraceae bacterium]